MALKTATADGAVIFGKNSDRPAGEGQTVRFYSGGDHSFDEVVQATYITLPQISRTLSVVLSQIDWMWGAEMGANERGVVIGNEAVWTKEPIEDTALLGMDLVRLGLERGETAQGALTVITDLLERFGQGGACAENDPSFSYHNSFLIADSSEAWILETASRHWVAERLVSGVCNISNGLTIRTKYDLASEGLIDYAMRRGYYNGAGAFDFAAAFSATAPDASPSSRQSRGECLMAGRRGRFSPESMMEVLRDHDSGICMHGTFETTSSMVAHIHGGGNAAYWFTGGPNPCSRPFKHVSISGPVCDAAQSDLGSLVGEPAA